jgi:hypothetical protein
MSKWREVATSTAVPREKGPARVEDITPPGGVRDEEVSTKRWHGAEREGTGDGIQRSVARVAQRARPF